MPLLLYCVAPESAVETSVRGVGGAEVRSTLESRFRFFYSEATELTTSGDVVAAARQVHAVVNDIFSRSPVLPFRYPTVLSDESELSKLAAERGAAFREYFERIGSRVQMDVRLTLLSDQADLQEHRGRVGQPAASGRAYLEARAEKQALLSAAAETCRRAAHSGDWRIREGTENIRCQALVSRVEVVSFLERMRTLELPRGVSAAISGPWPPAGFWEDEPR